MITKYSSASAQYDDLFKLATDRLIELGVKSEDGSGPLYDGVDVKINSLEEYFSNLRNLIYGPDDNPLTDKAKIKEGYVFLKLPVDEPYFTIDANKREIIVPDTFKKNGISVLGDEVSEMLFFSIDRFYDATDLSQLDIAFYWSHSADEDHTVYSTPAFFSVIESDEITGDDKLIFGWPISSDITKNAGKITFSVRFYSKDETAEADDYSLVYSLSTLTQTVSINNGLTYDIKGIDVDNRLESILSKRLVNSPLGKKDPPTMPILIFARTQNDTELTETFNITEQITSDVILAVLGFKADSGSLTYGWYYGDGENTPTLQTEFTSPLLDGGYIKTDSFITTEEDQIIATYYYKDTVNEYHKILIENAEDFETVKKERGTLYVNCSIYTLTPEDVKPGQYFARPRNTLYNASVINEDTPKYVWTISGADMPSITSQSWDADIIELADGLTLSIEGENLTTANYQWMADLTQTEIVNNNQLVFTEYSVNNELEVNAEGYYQLIVTNTKNNDSKAVNSTIVLALKPISTFNPVMINTDGVLSLSVRELEPFEKITYKWYNIPNLETVIAETPTFTIPAGKTGNDYRVSYELTKGIFSQSDSVNGINA